MIRFSLLALALGSRSALLAPVLVLSIGVPQPREKNDWIDPDTVSIARLDAAGGPTLYFHDNAFSPEGDKMMFNTPNGIAVADVAHIGKAELRPEIVAQGRSGYFARRCHR